MQRLTAAVKGEERPEHPPPRILLFYGKVRLILVELVGEGQSRSYQDDLGRIGGGKVQVRVDSQQDDAREAGLLLSACGGISTGTGLTVMSARRTATKLRIATARRSTVLLLEALSRCQSRLQPIANSMKRRKTRMSGRALSSMAGMGVHE